MDKIQQTTQEFKRELANLTNLPQLEELRIKYLGRNGAINRLLSKLNTVAEKDRKKIGRQINILKQEIEKTLAKKVSLLAKSAEDKVEIDVTLPGKVYPKGSLHPVTLTIEEISHIFTKIGFVRVSYPEVEWEYFCFDSLNMPAGHPARDDFETFFIDAPPDPKFGRMVLTPHTSSGQNREMLRLKKPPIRMINLAKCYRPNLDPTHTPMFYQFEGLCIDREINITHLKGTLDYFAKEFYGARREIRLRPFHFQFTEPSFEVDVSCGLCFGTGRVNGNKCRVCKSGWLELGGAGMVHPEVLKSGGLDPQKYSGFAFGWGVERTFMMKEGLKLDDIRILYSGDIRFLEQF
jgi:phenylalanyl-tRNA synthetase alpha chain